MRDDWALKQGFLVGLGKPDLVRRKWMKELDILTRMERKGDREIQIKKLIA